MATEIQFNLYSLILLMATLQGVLFALLLFFKRHQRRSINIHLSIMILAISSEVFQQFLIHSQLIFQYPLLVGFNLPFDALVGVALFWYVRAATHPEKSSAASETLKHYSIFFACVILSVPFWQMDFEPKLALMNTGIIDTNWEDSVFYSVGLQTALKIVSFSAYLFFSIKMLLEHKERIKELFSYREKITLSWLTNLLWIFLFGLIQGISILFFFQESKEVTAIMGFMPLFSILAIFYLGIMGLVQPRIFSSIEPSLLKNLAEVANNPPTKDEGHQTKKYEKSALTNKDMKRIATKLEQLLNQESTHLDPDLTMPQLAKKIAVSPNYLSQTLNIYFELSFFDFINQKRIEFSKQLLNDPKHREKSIVDIAIESAFNSRSAFYSAFKKQVGMTPTEYKNQLPIK